MAKIFITSTAVKTPWAPYALSDYHRVLRAHKQDSVKIHETVNSPNQADYILFVGSRCCYHFDILSSSLYNKFQEKCFVYDSQDNSLPVLPGIYMGIPKVLQQCNAYLFGFYLRTFDNGVLKESAPFNLCRYLYSFIGNKNTAPQVRSRVLQLDQARGLLQNSSSGQSDGDKKYAKLINESKFVLCPRGFGPSTWRLFEVMRTGRSPVIISDDWMPPMGPKWEDFAIIIPENEIENIPALLLSRESEAEQLGKRAYQEWKHHFSINTSFHWICERLIAIQKQRNTWQRTTQRSRIMEALSSKIHRRDFFKEYVKEFFPRSEDSLPRQ